MDGFAKIEWARRNMKVIEKIREEFRKEKPLSGLKIGAALHVEAKTAVLVLTLIDGGAEVYITGCNPMSTQDDVADALREIGISCYAKRGMNRDEYYEALRKVIRNAPDIVIDDGADLIFMLHGEMSDYAGEVKGASEETTTGVLRLRAMER
ncbi:MAG TPA: adenosylhomocysteinase, partial [Archaeoglobus sp.]|nr:adenosylhomocysteinase [Archaeoglobus sp.]